MPIRVGIVSAFVPLILQFLLGSQNKGHANINGLMLLVGRQEEHPACKKTEWWVAGVVICLERDADLHMAQLMPLPLTVSVLVKSRLVLPFWLTRVVLEKGPLNACVCVLSMTAMAQIYQTVIRTWKQLNSGLY